MKVRRLTVKFLILICFQCMTKSTNDNEFRANNSDLMIKDECREDKMKRGGMKENIMTSYDSRDENKTVLVGEHVNTIRISRSTRSITQQQQQISEDLNEDVKSLGGLLMAIVDKEMNNCALLIAHDGTMLYSNVIQYILLRLHNPRQVILVRSVDDLVMMNWESSGCDGYIMLLNHNTFLKYTNTYHHAWNYQGRYVLISQTLKQLEMLVVSRNVKKTENVLGIIKSEVDGEWKVYMNQLFWGDGVQGITTWRHNNFTLHKHLYPDKLSNLRGAVLKVSTFEFPPSIMYYRDIDGSLLYRFGEDIAIVLTLAKTLNFTIHFAEPSDGDKWGTVVEGNWTGLMGEITSDNVDIGLAQFFIKMERAAILDFSAPFTQDSSCFLARVEPPPPRWQALAFPFQRWTWIAIIIGLIMTGPVLFIISMAATGPRGKELAIFRGFGYSWLYTLGLHFREPQPIEPSMDGTRIFILFLWLYTMILTTAYSTNLTAFLLVRKSPPGIQTMQEIVDHGLEVAGLGSSGAAWLKGTKMDGLYKGYENTDEVYSMVRQGKSVYWVTRAYLNFQIVTRLSVKGVPVARIMRECFSPYNVAMGLQKHSPLKRRFDEVIGWIQQSGILKQDVVDGLRLAKTTKEYGGEELDGSEGSDDTVVALSIDHQQGTFMLACIGLILALLAFIFEVFVIPRFL